MSAAGLRGVHSCIPPKTRQPTGCRATCPRERDFFDGGFMKLTVMYDTTYGFPSRNTAEEKAFCVPYLSRFAGSGMAQTKTLWDRPAPGFCEPGGRIGSTWLHEISSR